jgi:Spy/CpxP family protein refolding chaperone
MKKTALAMLAAAALAATPAAAQFEGELTMKFTTREGIGTGRAYVSRVGARSELDIKSAHMPLKMTTLMKFSNPDVMIMINDQTKTYTEMDVKKTREQAAKMRGDKAKEAWVVKRVGRETVNGFSCENALVTRGDDAKSEQDWCLSKDVAGLSYESMRGLMRRGSPGEEGILKALHDAGVDGFVVKMVTREKGNPVPVSTMELTKVDRKSVPASLFEVPAGYTKQEGMMGAASVMAGPEAQDQMKKAMENLTPEQRKQIEEMMKRQQQSK